MPEIAVVYCTAPNLVTAQSIAQTLVTDALVACVNVMPQVFSTYRWEGSLCQSEESLMILKTSFERLEALESRMRELHPYKVFEFVVMDTKFVSASYRNWVLSSCQKIADK